MHVLTFWMKNNKLMHFTLKSEVKSVLNAIVIAYSAECATEMIKFLNYQGVSYYHVKYVKLVGGGYWITGQLHNDTSDYIFHEQ